MTKQTQSKSAAAKTATKHDPHALRVEAKAGDEQRVWAETILKPNITAALTLKLFAKQLIDVDAPITELTEELARQSELVSAGNLQRCEAMLISQAQTLDTIFNSLAVRSGRNMNEYAQTADLYMRLALKAQSQCRSTIEAIAETKNPKPIAFVKQANIAAGNQQVNNGDNRTLRAGACARENEIPQNKLLRDGNSGGLNSSEAFKSDIDLASRTADDTDIRERSCTKAGNDSE
jgi:hypothetical protein